MAPIAMFSKLIPTNQGHHKCRELWPTQIVDYEKGYNLMLCFFLLVLPLVVLAGAYSLITRSLWQGMRTERALKNHIANAASANAPNETQSTNNLVEVFINSHGTPSSRCSSAAGCRSVKCTPNHHLHHETGNNSNGTNGTNGGGAASAGEIRPWKRDSSWQQLRSHWSQESTRTTASSARRFGYHLRRTNVEQSLLNKKRVIQMLAMVVLEFFICWTPLYVINTMTQFGMSDILYENLTYAGISFCQLLAYSSSCCNPITYCFMNRGFRKAFLNLFRCFKRIREPRRISLGGLGGTVILGVGAGGSEGETAQLQHNHRMCTELSY